MNNLKKNLTLSVVTPVYNEIENINLFYSRLKKVLSQLNVEYEIIFVDDGSTDGSAEKIKQIAKKDRQVKAIVFSRNFGHQIAISAGLDYCAGDAAITIDSDLQDPPELIPELIKKWQDGFDVVYAIRKKRQDSYFKKITALFFYRFFSLISDINAPLDSGDFRLIDRKVITELRKTREKSRYFRGLIPWLGFNQASVYFDRDKRKNGQSKYSLPKMLKLSFDAITSFSVVPLKLIASLGLLILVIGLVCGVYIATNHTAITVERSTLFYMSALLLSLGGVELIAMGILGEYIGRIYSEAQNRPLYIIADKTNIDSK